MFVVTEKAMRPASDKRQCFYCQQPVGGTHGDKCVLVSRKVMVRMEIEYEVSVPASWDGGMINFHRNDGSWCCSNGIDEVIELHNKAEEQGGCLCHCIKYEYMRDTSPPFLSE